MLKMPDELRLGHPVIDAQHEAIILALRDIVVAYNENKAFAQLGEFMEKVTEYVQVHFQTEEAFMDRLDYPHTEAHKAIHQQFIDDWLEISLWYIGPNGGDNLFSLITVVGRVGRWLEDHILTKDMYLAQWVREKDGTASKSSSPES